MKKLLLLVLLASTTFVGSLPAYSQATPAPSDSKIKTAGKKMGNAIMWGPKKIGAGLKKMGGGMKKMMGK